MSLYNTPQSVFNQVWQYFIIERHPAGFDPKNQNCIYLGSKGQRCALGCCIPPGPEFAQAHSFGGGAHSFHDDLPVLWEAIFDDILVDFMAAIQETHDKSAMPRTFGASTPSLDTFLEGMEGRLRSVAITFGLNVPPLKETPATAT